MKLRYLDPQVKKKKKKKKKNNQGLLFNNKIFKCNSLTLINQKWFYSEHKLHASVVDPGIKVQNIRFFFFFFFFFVCVCVCVCANFG